MIEPTQTQLLQLTKQQVAKKNDVRDAGIFWKHVQGDMNQADKKTSATTKASGHLEYVYGDHFDEADDMVGLKPMLLSEESQLSLEKMILQSNAYTSNSSVDKGINTLNAATNNLSKVERVFSATNTNQLQHTSVLDEEVSSKIFRAANPVSGATQSGLSAQLYELKWYAGVSLSYDGKYTQTIQSKKLVPSTFKELPDQGNEISSNIINKSEKLTAIYQTKNLAPINSIIMQQKSILIKNPQSIGRHVHSTVTLPEYLKTKVTFIENDDVVEIRLRDYRLTGAEQELFVTNMKAKYSNINKLVTSITINGKDL